ncbi:MAG: hypothetical protein AMS18_06085 [Gemmatimonas sp. SG8_17]|nr:MAG: hypothetical protein AMS18_06085 [Gemmatimonas sp. SG8_17]
MKAALGPVLTAVVQASQPTPLPVDSPLGGPFWSYVVPAALLTLASVGTLLLYRHFARHPD